MTGYFAMPFACAALLALDVGLRTLLGSVALAQPAAMVSLGSVTGLGLALLLVLTVGARSAALLRPVNERA
ncbi:MAG: hypothetical protein HPM95_06145 [Alphaproteobacteria bacterium]|nr:hypothetical protein [Alphaproteobacteria bacterium]